MDVNPRPDPGRGTAALEDGGGRVDFGALRRERRERCLEEMARHGIDALVLGREGNGRYVSGARRLWLAGARPYGPRCVLSREGAEVHLLSLSDDDVPAEIRRENLFGATWNPMNLGAALKKIPALADAKRIGVDGMSPLFEKILRDVAPAATLVDGESLMRAVRRTKLPAEIACIETAIAIAEGALAATLPEIRPGAVERTLVGRFGEAAARYGVTIPAFEATFCATPREAGRAVSPPLRQLPGERPLAEGDLVAAHAGVLYAGYEGSLARTRPCTREDPREPSAAERALFRRWRDLHDRLLEVLRPGRTGADLLEAHAAAGEPLPPLPIAYGVGLGMESPIVGKGFAPDREPFTPGMVVALQAYVWNVGTGGVLGKEIVHVTDRSPRRLTRLAHVPFAVGERP